MNEMNIASITLNFVRDRRRRSQADLVTTFRRFLRAKFCSVLLPDGFTSKYLLQTYSERITKLKDF